MALPGRGPARCQTRAMRKFSLDAQVREHLRQAAAASNGRSAQTVYGGHEQALRQTLIALTAQTVLSDHENPGEATLLVLRGRVRLTCREDAWEAMAGDLLVMPHDRHGVEALEDSAVLLTVTKRR